MGRHGWRRRLAVTTIAAGASLALLAPAAGASSDARRRTDDPRNRRPTPRLSAFAETHTPYVIQDFQCGQAVTVNTPTRFVTLYAYGGDGGDNAYGVHGGSGSNAIGAFGYPAGTPLVAAPGCAGTTATLTGTGASAGGLTKGVARGGVGTAGGDPGARGGGGGGLSAWYVDGRPLLESGGGGGAGGRAGGGAGGDAGHDGAPATGDAGKGGGAGSWDARGTGGAPSGQPGLAHNGGKGGGHGGGGGGSGKQGGGGGGQATPGAPGAGGGGAGSDVYTTTSLWLEHLGQGNGIQFDGVNQLVRVRPIVRNPLWSTDVVRGVTNNGYRGGGYIVDARGNIKAFSQGPTPAVAHPSATWPGFDIARGIATLPDRTGGYVVDLYGRLHPFSTGSNGPPPAVTGRAIWPGKDMARGVAINPEGTGGYVLGRNGSLVPFAIGNNPKPKAATNVPSWPGQDVARGVTAPFLDFDGKAGGWISDTSGRLHPWGVFFGGTVSDAVGPAVPNARGIASFVDGAGGVIVDRYGHLYPFASPGYPMPGTPLDE